MSRFALILCSILFFSPPSFAADSKPDAAAALGEAATGANPDMKKLRDAYLKLQWERLLGNSEVKRLEATQVIRGESAPELNADERARLKAWLEQDTAFRDRLLLALSPYDDDYPSAARVALTLHDKFQKQFTELENLAIAFVTVWDDRSIVKTLHGWHVPELMDDEKMKTCTLEEAFGWFASKQTRLCPWLKTMPWRLLTYVASDSTTIPERDWVMTKFPVFRNNFGTVYSDIEYDMVKLRDAKGKIAGHQYTMENVKQYGGVCRDQAWFARAVCSTYGMPAYFAVGQGNSAVRHAWVGWIIQEAGAYKLLSHGRYEYDKYFTAQIVDPRTGLYILDYLVGIEARALSDEKGYEAADLYYRVWQECPQLPAQNRVNLLVSALRKNAFHRAAWLSIGDSTAAGDLPRASAEAQWDYLLKNFRDFPDFTFSMLSAFSRMFKTPAERYTFYETTAKYFVNVKRQDLVASLRIEEIDMCVSENRKDLAAQVAVAATQECAGEGEQGSALAKRAAELLTEMNQPQLAIKPLQMALTKMPKTRAKFINPHWYSVMEVLRDVYKASGDSKNAAGAQAEIDKVVKTAAVE